jgi:hypothetical protein
MRRIPVLICTMLLGVVVCAQVPTMVWIMGDVTVTTSDSLTHTAVRVKGRMWRDSQWTGEHDTVFCITHANPIPAKLDYTGRGRVVYRVPRRGKPTAKAPRVEKILPTLAVLQANGESPFFLAEGQPFAYPPWERTAGHMSTFAIVSLVRQDVRDLKGERQKTTILSCVESKR